MQPGLLRNTVAFALPALAGAVVTVIASTSATDPASQESRAELMAVGVGMLGIGGLAVGGIGGNNTLALLGAGLATGALVASAAVSGHDELATAWGH